MSSRAISSPPGARTTVPFASDTPLVAPTEASAFRRALAGLSPIVKKLELEPWYNWGTIDIERMEGIFLDGEHVLAGGEGPVRYLEIQWIGLHFQVQLGRTPKAVR